MKKRLLSMLLVLTMVLSLVPGVALAASAVGDTTTTPNNVQPEAPEGYVWVQTDKQGPAGLLSACAQGFNYEHTHDDDCYAKKCDHKNGHLSTCYASSTAYEVCPDKDNHTHTGTANLTDVVTIDGTNVSWVTTHPAYPAVYAIYKAAYDEAYNNAPWMKDTQGKIAGVAAVAGVTVCYTTTAGEEPICGHVCSEVRGECYELNCLYKNSEEHTCQETDSFETSCYVYTWTLYADVNGNGVGDGTDADPYYTVVYTDADGVLATETYQMVQGQDTPAYAGEIDRPGYTHVWTGPATSEDGLTITYTAAWTPIDYTITWDNGAGTWADGSEDVVKTQTNHYGDKLTAPEVVAPEDYTFNGWDPAVNDVTKSVTYTAQYTEDTVYSVTFMVLGEEFNVQYVNVTKNETIDNPGEPAEDGYVFAGWDNNVIYTTPAENLVVNAVMKADTNGNGKADEDETVTITVNVEGNGTAALNNGGNDKIIISGSNPYTVVYDSVNDNGDVIYVSTTNGTSQESNVAYYLSKIAVDGTVVEESFKAQDATVTVTFAAMRIDAEDGEMNVYGIDDMTSDELVAAIKTATKETATPDSVENGVVTEYLALDETITVLGQTYDLVYWAVPGEDVSLENYLSKIFGDRASAMLALIEQYVNLDTITPHAFGTEDVETVRYTYKDDSVTLEKTVMVTMKDLREETFISGSNAKFVYDSFTYEQLVAAVAPVVKDANGTVLEVEVSVEDITGNNAGEHNVTIRYAGDNTYQPCEATVTVVIDKAPVTISVANNQVKYGQDYDVAVTTDPEISTIQFVVGLDVADMYLDGEEIAGTAVKVNVILPGTLGKIIDGTFTAGELASLINEYKDILVLAGVSEEALTALTATLTALEEQFGELEISINADMPTNIGVYAVGAITADMNYETEVAVGYLIITPNGIKADMEWIETDDNHIITLGKLSTFNLGATATVDEATVDNAKNWSNEAATEQIEYLFLGVDSNGEMMLNADPAQMKNASTGVYTQIAYMINWGNDMYYAEPIARPIIVSPNVADVDILDVNGNENYAQVYTYGDEITLNVTVNGEKAPMDGLTVKYIGSDTTVDGWYRDEVPTDAGVYTVVAVYTDKNEAGELIEAGGAFGVLVIEPKDIEVGLEDAEYCYDGKEHFADITNEALDYITIAIDRENNVAYVNLPDDTAEHLDRITAMLPAEVKAEMKALLDEFDGDVSSENLKNKLTNVIIKVAAVDMTAEAKAVAEELVNELAAQLENSEDVKALLAKLETEADALKQAVKDQIPAEVEDYLREVITVAGGVEIDVEKVKADLKALLADVKLPAEVAAELAALVDELTAAAKEKVDVDELEKQIEEILAQVENLEQIDAKTIVKYMLGAIYVQIKDMDEVKALLVEAAAKVEARGYVDYLKNMAKTISGMYQGEIDTAELDSAIQALATKVEDKILSGEFDADDLTALEGYVDDILLEMAAVVDQIPAGTFVFGKNPTEPGEYDCYAMNISANYKWEFVEADLTINPADGHKWDEGTVTANPDCENDGNTHYVCSVCGATKDEPIAKLNHNYVETERVEPTATKDGYVKYTCQNDPSHFYTETLPATGSGQGGGSGSGGGSAKPVLNKKEHFAFLAGYPDETFRPDNNMTRAEVAAMFYNLIQNKDNKAHASSFSDVAEDAWYAKAVGYIEYCGIMSGYPDGTFAPDAPITRAEFATVATAFDKLTKGDCTFSDVSEDAWYYTFVSFAAEKGWVSGYPDGTFRPAQYITRAEVTAVTCKLLERMADQEYVVEHEDELVRVFTDLPDENAHWGYWFIVEATNGHDYVKAKNEETWKDINK